MKVIWEQLMEAANSYTDFKLKYNISAFNEKTIFLVCLFYCFWLLIYEAIAAISWQSASYFYLFALNMFRLMSKCENRC